MYRNTHRCLKGLMAAVNRLFNNRLSESGKCVTCRCKVYFHYIADISVGYELTVYTTSENMRNVQICAVLMAPGPVIALRGFVLSSTTESGTASKFNHKLHPTFQPFILV